MLTHDNLLAAASATARAFGGRGRRRGPVVPPAVPHRRAVDLGRRTPSRPATSVNFREGREHRPAPTCAEIQPTFFLGVPRVWEKYLAGVEIRMEDASALKRANYRFWMKRGKKIAAKRLSRRSARGGLLYFLGWLFLYRSIRRKLGLGRVREALSGAAPIAPQVLEWFWAIGVPVREGYGQTEGTALGTFNPRDDVRIGTVGKPLIGRRGAHRRGRRDPRCGRRRCSPATSRTTRPPRRRSTATDGCTPATSGCSTATATSRSPTARRTSSSPPAARTSRRPRSRTSSRSRRTSGRRSSSATAAST